MDNVYLAKNWSVLNFGLVLNIAIAFGLSVIFAHFLDKEAYGQYKYILSVISLLTIASLQSMDDLVAQATAQGNEGTIFLALGTKLRWSLLGSAAALGLAFYYWFNHNNLLAGAFAATVPLLPIFANFSIYLAYLQGKKQFSKQITYSAISQLVFSVAMAITIVLTRNPLILVATYLLSQALARFFIFWYVIKKDRPNKNTDLGAIDFGKKLSLIDVLFSFSSNLDSIITFHYVGAAALAVYSFAFAPIVQIRSVLKNLRVIALPKFAVRSSEEIKVSLVPRLMKLTLIILVVIAVYFFAAPWIFKIFFPRYLDAINYTRWLSLSLLAFPATMVPLVLQAKGLKKELYQSNFLLPFCRIVLMVALIPKFGLAGLIATELSMVVVSSVISWFYFSKI